MPEINIERMVDRCLRMCGEVRTDCYVSSRRQMNCLSDLIINKTAGMTMALTASLEMGDCKFMEETVRESLTNANELSNWIKYMQAIPDLQAVGEMVLDADTADKRTEIRYPMPEAKVGQLRVLLEGSSEASLLNFSQSGLRLLSPVPMRQGDMLDCKLTADVEILHTAPFRATVINSFQSPGGLHSCGLLVKELGGSKAFNFFNMAHQILIDIPASGNGEASAGLPDALMEKCLAHLQKDGERS